MKYVSIALIFVIMLCGCKKSTKSDDSDKSIYTEGQVEIRGTQSCDLDLGVKTNNESRDDADFFWGQSTAIIRYFRPTNGAEFSIMGQTNFNSTDYYDLINLNYSTDDIDGSDNEGNQIPVGTVLAFKTNENRYGKMIIDEYGYNLTLRWTTYDNSD